MTKEQLFKECCMLVADKVEQESVALTDCLHSHLRFFTSIDDTGTVKVIKSALFCIGNGDFVGGAYYLGRFDERFGEQRGVFELYNKWYDWASKKDNIVVGFKKALEVN